MKRSTGAWVALAGACLAAAVWAATASTRRIVIIGDSTVCNYAASKYPQTGWGQVLSLYFKSGSVTVVNDAIGGRSSRSFIEGGRWATTLASLQPGDILMVQFGHNDRDFSKEERYTDTTDYKKYLGQYAREARAKGAHPVFVTPMNMNTWTGTAVREVFTEGANNYRAAMIHAAADNKVPVLDLEKKSKLLMDTLGQAYLTKFHFLGLDAGEYPNFPDGVSDGTHFQELGALENARMVVEEISCQPDDSILKLLAPLVAPLRTVTVEANLKDAGTLTRTRRYPKGATVTLKVKPASGKVFQGWADESGKVVSTAQRYTFVQDTLEKTFTAKFQGGSSVVVPAAHPLPLRLDGRKLIGLPGSAARVVDASGRVVLVSPGGPELDLSGLGAGAYWVELPAGPARGLILE
ncbi:MAG TPA: GDSL-type esterase/lipase family protein [Fibrobacteria bacterium]|nr:GDSL-type esterase/lipase family protein [Fibrobacteria bacterium]HOX50006.1 GDSL-type esterase/lipase family protein [Fibrobacteria bacterium]